MEISSLSFVNPDTNKVRINALGVCLLSAQFLLVGSASAAAPTPSSTDIAVRQAESLKQQQAQNKPEQAASDEPPETYPGENQDLGPQMLLKKKKKKALFEFSEDSMFTWTSNALSSGSNPREAGIIAETFSLTFAPEPFDFGPGKLGLRSGYRHLFWMYDAARLGHQRPVGDSNYGTLNFLNFEMSTLFVGSNYSFDENWNASLGLDYNRILNDQGLDPEISQLASGDPAIGSEWSLGRMLDYSKWSEVYKEWNPNWGLSRNIPLGDQTNLTLSYSGGYHFTATDQDIITGKTNSGDKLDNALSVSLTYSPLEKVMLQPNVRFSHSLYTQPQSVSTLRRDHGITPGLTVMWMPTARLSVRWSLSADFRYCNDQTLSPNSSKLDAGTGVSLSLKF